MSVTNIPTRCQEIEARHSPVLNIQVKCSEFTRTVQYMQIAYERNYMCIQKTRLRDFEGRKSPVNDIFC